MLETFEDSCNKVAHVYVTALLGTRDRIQESWGTRLLHTSQRRVSLDKGQDVKERGGKHGIVPEHSQCDPSRLDPSNWPHTISARSCNSDRLSCHLPEPVSL